MRKIILQIILPITTILLITYFVANNLTSRFGFSIIIIISAGLGLLGIFPFYSILSIIFPDENNTSIPPQFIRNKNSELLENAKETIAYKTSAFLSIITMIIIGLLIYYYPKSLKEKELKTFGITTKGYIFNQSNRRSKYYSGKKRKYLFIDNKGVTHKDITTNSYYKKGDSIIILYSSRNPEINEIISKINN